MPARKKKPSRDREKEYSRHQFADKLRRLADSIEQGKRFRIQIAGERISVPPTTPSSASNTSGKAAGRR